MSHLSHPRVLTAADLDLREFVRPGDTIAWGQACGEPQTLTEKLLEQREFLGRPRCFSGIPTAATLLPEHADHLDLVSYCGTGSNRKLAQAGVLEIFPGHYSTLPAVLSQGELAVDVALVQVSAADANGRHSYGLADDYTSALVRAARVVIVEVNDQVPQTPGMTGLQLSEATAVLYSSRPPATHLSVKPSHQVRQVAKRVAELIPDGSTLQFGLGGVPEAVLAELGNKNDLGVHSGLIGDGVIKLMNDGVINNRRKSLDAGRTVAGLIVGTAPLFEFVNRNPAIWLCGTDYTHDPFVLASQERFVAINSAIEVDLTGQVNAETIGGNYVGAVGGSMDFLRAAARSIDGVPIIALPSTGGGASRIVKNITGPVSTSRADVGIVVTEHGVADLRGKTLQQRRELMLTIADPMHHDSLAA